MHFCGGGIHFDGVASGLTCHYEVLCWLATPLGLSYSSKEALVTEVLGLAVRCQLLDTLGNDISG